MKLVFMDGRQGVAELLVKILKFQVLFRLVFHEIMILLAGCRASKSGCEVFKGRP